MNKAFSLSLLVIAAGFTLTVMANERPTKEFQTSMNDALDVLGNAGLRSHVPAKDYDGIALDADKFTVFFDAKMLPFWTQRHSEDGIRLSKEGSEAALALKAAARAKNDGAILTAATRLSGTCEDCHLSHREQLPHKMYEIK